MEEAPSFDTHKTPCGKPAPILRQAILAILLALLFSGSGRTDPVPDELIHELWDLIDATAETGQCPDRERLVELFGSYGLGFLERSHRTKIEREFDVFAPVLVASQAPPYLPGLAVQGFYRENANEVQEQQMLMALGEWLTADISEAPRTGTERLEGPEELVDEAIDYARTVAAEMLADWGDTGADSLMAALEVSGDLTDEALWRLRRARGRLVDPCAVSFLRVKPDGDLECCTVFSDLQHITAGRGGWRWHKEAYRLSPEEMESIWSLIPESRLGKKSNWGGNIYNIVFEFADGVKASMSPTEKGRLVYYDNTMLQGTGWHTLENKDLYTLVWDLFERELGAEAP